MTHALTPSGAMRNARRPATLLMVSLLVALAGLIMAGPTAHADDKSGSTTDGTGWIRLTHLSPDTPAVDVRLTSLSNSKKVVSLSDVSYGDVSPYERVAAGRYVAAMTPAGGNARSKPVITQSVTVQKDYAYTVAAIGKNADLKGLVLNDDLRAPKSGQAKIRLIQASTNAPKVTVTAMGGPVLAREAAFGSATGYASVQTGVWTVALDPAGGSTAKASSLKVTATPGSVNTLVLLNGANGSLQGKVLKDAGGAAKMPTKGKGVNTGGGGTATQFVDDPAGTSVATTDNRPLGVGALVVVAATLMLVSRQRLGGGSVRRRGTTE